MTGAIWPCIVRLVRHGRVRGLGHLIGSGFFTSHHAGEPDNGDFPAIVVSPLDDEFDVLGLVIAAPCRRSTMPEHWS